MSAMAALERARQAWEQTQPQLSLDLWGEVGERSQESAPSRRRDGGLRRVIGGIPASPDQSTGGEPSDGMGRLPPSQPRGHMQPQCPPRPT